MVVTKDVAGFVRHNEKDLRHFMSYKTGIYDKDLIDEAIQEFYIRLIKTRALETYDCEEGSFDTYVMNLFCWLLPLLKKKNFRFNHKVVSVVTTQASGYAKEEDIWNLVSGKGGCILDFIPRYEIDKRNKKSKCKEYFREDHERYIEENSFNAMLSTQMDYGIDPRYSASASDLNESAQVDSDFRSFVRYVKKIELGKWQSNILSYLKYRAEGCNNNEIASSLQVSSTMVSIIRNRAFKAYKAWRGTEGS